MGQPLDLHGFPTSAPEDFARLGFEPQRVPSILAMMLRAENPPAGPHSLSPSEAKEVVEILDKVMSSANVTQDLKWLCSEILCNTCRSHDVLPTSWAELNVVSGGVHMSGTFTDVHKGHHAGNTVRIMTFRAQPPKRMGNIRRELYSEVVRWKYVSHPNVLPLLGVSHSPRFSIITCWTSNGDIGEYIQQNPGVNRLRLLAQSASGLQCLHSFNIVHGAVFPANILIKADGVACVADLGILKVMTDPSVVEPSKATSEHGIIRYMAPEQINPSQFGLTNSNPSKRSDVHSLAMTAYEVLTGIKPYTNSGRDNEIMKDIVKGIRPPRPLVAPGLPDPIWETMGACWKANPSSRLDICQVYNALLHSAGGVDGSVTENGTGGTGSSGAVGQSPPPTPPVEPSLEDTTPREASRSSPEGKGLRRTSSKEANLPQTPSTGTSPQHRGPSYLPTGGGSPSQVATPRHGKRMSPAERFGWLWTKIKTC